MSTVALAVCPRPSSWAALDRPVSCARFVDARRTEALKRLGIETIGDLLTHYPFRYIDLTTVLPVRDVPLGAEVTVVGTVHDVRVKQPRPRLSVTEVAIGDDSGIVVGVWFNQPYIAARLRVGDRVALAGRMELDFGLRQMRTPFLERLADDSGPELLGRILPVHRTTEGLTTNWLRRLIRAALDDHGHIPDHLPAALLADRALPPVAWTLEMIHFPRTMADVEVARRRLAYDELLIMQLALAKRRHDLVTTVTGHAHRTDGPALRALRAAVPFTLTHDQERAISEILDDMAAPRPMHRLLLGDVGTGKTVVAAHALACVADSGTQAAVMAPTEVLAQQYETSLGPLLRAAGVRYALLTGSTPARKRDVILESIERGEITVVFGTHALIRPDVTFDDLTLAIIDEQHRFGVRQRLALRSKGERADLLVMTATPIPRSLALTLYGDLDASYLTERPARARTTQVETRIIGPTARAQAYDEVRRAIAAGRQAYIVCAVVDEHDAAEVRSANREAERLARVVFPDLRVGLLTGRMQPAEKIAVMERFRRHEIDILVATTVIEVGIDVPNATVMIVENGERYGLAQLHQLRGRVGRGEHPGLFMVFANPRTEEGVARMQAIQRSSDGFALAEEDLRLRGEGELLGERQSGMPPLRIASLARDGALIDATRSDATRIIREDPTLTDAVHGPLRVVLERRLREAEGAVSSG